MGEQAPEAPVGAVAAPEVQGSARLTDSITAGEVGEERLLPAVRRGRRLDTHFELQSKVLGTGVSGSVLEAVCRQSGRPVAVKSFKKRGLRRQAIEALRQEGEIHAAMDHPHIVKLEGLFECDDSLHIVTEQLRGGELFDRVVACIRFSEPEAAKAIVQVLLAVAYLHARRVMHRDIKPENLLYTDREADHIKLIDFGFATHFNPFEKQMRKCGTFQYVAPEVLNGCGYNEKADMWSVGSVAYSMLTGEAAYGGSQVDIWRKSRLGAMDLGRTFKSLSGEAQGFITSLVRVDPGERSCALQALAHPWLRKYATTQAVEAMATATAYYAGVAAGQAVERPLKLQWSGRPACTDPIVVEAAPAADLGNAAVAAVGPVQLPMAGPQPATALATSPGLVSPLRRNTSRSCCFPMVAQTVAALRSSRSIQESFHDIALTVAAWWWPAVRSAAVECK